MLCGHNVENYEVYLINVTTDHVECDLRVSHVIVTLMHKLVR